MPPQISIVMATYNGERYLSEQIASFFHQTDQEWQLVIRDDQSSDRTPDIIKEYVGRYPDKIKQLEGESGQLGALHNFSRLLSSIDSDYILFSDQDDIWLPYKIEITLDKMKETEKRCGSSVPILIHTDLKVADQDLAILAGSLWRYQRLNPQNGGSLNRLLVQNVVTGCTMMINRALKSKVGSVPTGAVMHDWWIALVAAAFGKIDYVSTPTVLYRQHGENRIGAKERIMADVLKNTWSKRNNIKAELQKSQLQAGAFLGVFNDDLIEEQRNLLRAYFGLGDQNFISRRISLARYGFFKTGFVRNLGLFLSV